ADLGPPRGYLRGRRGAASARRPADYARTVGRGRPGSLRSRPSRAQTRDAARGAPRRGAGFWWSSPRARRRGGRRLAGTPDGVSLRAQGGAMMVKWTGLERAITDAEAQAEPLEDQLFGPSFDRRQKALGGLPDGVNRNERPWRKPDIIRQSNSSFREGIDD